MSHIDIRDNFLFVSRYTKNVEEIIEKLNNYIMHNDCQHLSIDISVLNMIDALKTSAICSAHHFGKYPAGKLEWVVKDMETRNTIKTLALKTVETSIKQPIIKDFGIATNKKLAYLR